MRRFCLTFLMFGLSAFYLSACSSLLGGRAPATRMFVLAAADCSNFPEKPVINTPIIVPQPRASYSLAGQRILFANTGAERSAYQFAEWLEPLPDMARKALVKKLECARIGTMVISQPDRADHGLGLSIELIEFYHDTEVVPGHAEVSIKGQLTDLNAQRTKATVTISKRADVKSYDIDGASTALGEALNAALDELVAWTAIAASAQPNS